jgi:hypothetical protein
VGNGHSPLRSSHQAKRVLVQQETTGTQGHFRRRRSRAAPSRRPAVLLDLLALVATVAVGRRLKFAVVVERAKLRDVPLAGKAVELALEPQHD